MFKILSKKKKKKKNTKKYKKILSAVITKNLNW